MPAGGRGGVTAGVGTCYHARPHSRQWSEPQDAALACASEVGEFESHADLRAWVAARAPAISR